LLFYVHKTPLQLPIMFIACPGWVNVSEVIIMKKKHVQSKNDVAKNSSMAENMEEMRILGKQLEQMKTNEELEKEGKYSDPLQQKAKLPTKKT